MSHRVALGRSGLQVSPICYGSWQLSPRFWGTLPEQEVGGAMKKAFDCGINFYDTADAYGDGLAEEVLGRALKDFPRKDLVIATKVFNRFYPDGRRHGDLSKDYILRACDDSLRRMKMDYIDLYQCHSWDPLVEPAEVADALKTLQCQGKIRVYGASNWSVEQLRFAEPHGDFQTLQPSYSLLRRDSERDLLPYCQAHRTGVLVYSPLQKGVLTGKYKGGETFTDHRKDDPLYQGERFKKLCAKAAQVGEIAKRYDLTTTQLVLAATLMHPAIHVAIQGVKTPAQVEEAAGAMGKRISKEDYYNVKNLLTE